MTNLSSASEIASLGSRGDGIEAGVLDVGGDVHVVQVSQHHDGGEEKSGGVGLVLTSDIWGRAVDLNNYYFKAWEGFLQIRRGRRHQLRCCQRG